MILLFFYLFLALIVSFLCSIMEAVLLSTTLSFLRVKEEKESSSAKLFIKLKENIDLAPVLLAASRLWCRMPATSPKARFGRY